MKVSGIRFLALYLVFNAGAGSMVYGQTPASPPKSAVPAPSVAPAKPAPVKTAAASSATAGDKRIEAAIRTKLARSKIGKDGFTVRVQGGVVYWDGTTGVPQHKGAATRMAKTAGAVAVINNIKAVSYTHLTLPTIYSV